MGRPLTSHSPKQGRKIGLFEDTKLIQKYSSRKQFRPKVQKKRGNFYLTKNKALQIWAISLKLVSPFVFLINSTLKNYFVERCPGKSHSYCFNEGHLTDDCTCVCSADYTGPKCEEFRKYTNHQILDTSVVILIWWIVFAEVLVNKSLNRNVRWRV